MQDADLEFAVECGEGPANRLGEALWVMTISPLERAAFVLDNVVHHGGSVELRPVDFEVQGTWDGGPLREGEFARLQLNLEAASDHLTISVEAAFFDDPKPDGPPGSQLRLWEFEVVELFGKRS